MRKPLAEYLKPLLERAAEQEAHQQAQQAEQSAALAQLHPIEIEQAKYLHLSPVEYLKRKQERASHDE
jgi:hypothetical protein